MNDSHYKTTDYGLAAYFISRGYFCAGTVSMNDPGRPDRQAFVFVDVEDPKSIEDDWYRYRKESMSARDYFEKLRTASRMLKEKR
jgi:hypothetical protein